MKKLIDFWWDKSNKNFSAINYKKAWKENNNKPCIRLSSNGGKRKNNNSCFDGELVIGYIIFNYTNFNLQRNNVV